MERLKVQLNWKNFSAIALIATGILFVSWDPVDPPESKLPNIILVMADDQGWGDMAYYGHPVLQTPHFDAMAEEAIRFDHFYAASSVCSPTRGSVLTGRNPNRFGCFSWGRTLRPQEHTLAEVLQEAGYITGHFGKWHLGSVRMGSPVNPGSSGFDTWLSAPNFYDNNPILSRNGIAEQMNGESSMVTVDAALEFIRKNEGKDQPYLAVVWFGSPHNPHRAIDKDRFAYADEDEDFQHFYGEITGMDRAFGKLRDEIKSLATYQNTILWYCSDNGGLPKYGSTGGRGHKGQMYEGGLRIPSIIQWPAKLKKPGAIKVPSSTADIFPTILDMLNIRADPDRPFDGISLAPFIKNPELKRSTPIGFWDYPGGGIRTPSAEWMAELLQDQKQGDMIGDSSRLRLEDIKIKSKHPLDSLPGHAAWLDWPLKLHRIEDKGGDVTWELYNLERDSMETKNLHKKQSRRMKYMLSSLETWQRSVILSLNGEDY